MPPPPRRCAPIATALTGAHLPHPTAATLARSCGSRTEAAAPLTPTAPMREPPNQAAAPRSCRERTRVLRDDMKFLRSSSHSQAGECGWRFSARTAPETAITCAPAYGYTVLNVLNRLLGP